MSKAGPANRFAILKNTNDEHVNMEHVIVEDVDEGDEYEEDNGPGGKKEDESRKLKGKSVAQKPSTQLTIAHELRQVEKTEAGQVHKGIDNANKASTSYLIRAELEKDDDEHAEPILKAVNGNPNSKNITKGIGTTTGQEVQNKIQIEDGEEGDQEGYLLKAINGDSSKSVLKDDENKNRDLAITDMKSDMQEADVVVRQDPNRNLEIYLEKVDPTYTPSQEKMKLSAPIRMLNLVDLKEMLAEHFRLHGIPNSPSAVRVVIMEMLQATNRPATEEVLKFVLKLEHQCGDDEGKSGCDVETTPLVTEDAKFATIMAKQVKGAVMDNFLADTPNDKVAILENIKGDFPYITIRGKKNKKRSPKS